jgi:hypothetical protein
VPQALHDESWDLMQAGVMVALMRRRWTSRVFFRRTKVVALWLAICLPLYVLSTGSVAWATDNAFHPPYLPEEVNLVYLALVPTAKIQCINQLFSCGHNCCNGSTGPLCLRAVPCPVVRREKTGRPR